MLDSKANCAGYGAGEWAFACAPGSAAGGGMPYSGDLGGERHLDDLLEDYHTSL